MQTFLDAMPMTKEKNDRSLTTSDMEPDRSTGTRCQIERQLVHIKTRDSIASVEIKLRRLHSS